MGKGMTGVPRKEGVPRQEIHPEFSSLLVLPRKMLYMWRENRMETSNQRLDPCKLLVSERCPFGHKFRFGRLGG